jgi:hypothetical protein
LDIVQHRDDKSSFSFRRSFLFSKCFLFPQVLFSKVVSFEPKGLAPAGATHSFLSAGAFFFLKRKELFRWRFYLGPAQLAGPGKRDIAKGGARTPDL